VTEALQLYPRCSNYDEWLSSGPVNHLYTSCGRNIPFEDISDLSSNDLLENIQRTVALLGDVGSEVIVVDLSFPDTPFSVVRVLATELQPVIIPGTPRFSKRLFQVPVAMGWRDKALRPEDLSYRQLCGYSVSLDATQQ
jgi:hypothetical protein